MNGEPHVVVSDAPLSLDDLLAHVGGPEHGGTVTFTGTTRRDGDDDVDALEYDVYDAMALAEMRRIAVAAQERHGARVAVAHRRGRVAVGEASVAIAASAGHRAAAFAACRQVIDAVKADVPIWKRSVHADGRTAWQDGTRPPAPERTRDG